ncbi:antitoxin family protein [uncultured Sphaerotilus sp.]|uniref:antitoxin family protein n=1 Tax=uncultured Sphaerotilus sp. TaxID=474984 RepID=UPI0030CA5ADA
MYQAIEAVCRAGQIVPLEPVHFEENEHLVIVRMPAARPAAASPAGGGDWQSLAGVLKDSPHWNGDPLAVQEAMRHEWD